MFSPIVSPVVNVASFNPMVEMLKSVAWCLTKGTTILHCKAHGLLEKFIRCKWKTKGTNLEILVGEFIDFAFKHLKEFINSNIKA